MRPVLTTEVKILPNESSSLAGMFSTSKACFYRLEKILRSVQTALSLLLIVIHLCSIRICQGLLALLTFLLVKFLSVLLALSLSIFSRQKPIVFAILFMCWSRRKNLDFGQHPFKPIIFVNLAVPTLEKRPYYKNASNF